jgi:RNA polymerase sigma-70 factor (ECF subfamily)
MAAGDDAVETRASLLARLRDPADDASWRTFVDLYGPIIVGYCRRLGLQDADAADVAQDVLTGVVRSIRTFEYDRERGRFRDWLRTVVRNRVGRFLRDVAGQPAWANAQLDGLPAAAQDGDWTEAFNTHILRAALDRIRSHFEPATWEAFNRAWQEQRPAAAVAAELGMGVDAVYVAKSRVLKRLRAEVTALADDWPFPPEGPPAGSAL